MDVYYHCLSFLWLIEWKGSEEFYFMCYIQCIFQIVFVLETEEWILDKEHIRFLTVRSHRFTLKAPAVAVKTLIPLFNPQAPVSQYCQEAFYSAEIIIQRGIHISQLFGFMRSGDKTFYRFLNRGPGNCWQEPRCHQWPLHDLFRSYRWQPERESLIITRLRNIESHVL